MCIRTSFLHLFYFFPIHPAGPVWLRGSECYPISYLWTESRVKFASFATVKDPWKLLMLSCPSVGVWLIHLKLPELRWVKPWSCLLLSVIMMQLKKRKQKERKGLHVREIWVQLNKSGPTRSVTLSLTLWTLWAVCFPAARWELWAKWNTLRQSYFTKAWAEVHKERKNKEAVSILCIFIFSVHVSSNCSHKSCSISSDTNTIARAASPLKMTDIKLDCFEQMRKSAFAMKVSGHRSGKQRRTSLGWCEAKDKCAYWGWKGLPTHLCPERLSSALTDNQGLFFICCRDRCIRKHSLVFLLPGLASG